MAIKKSEEKKGIELAYIDDLTGIYNRRYLYKYLSEELPKVNQLALFMIDLDGFKKINDTYGHLEGDALLVVFSKILKNVVADDGIVMRYAGDEFTVVLPEKKKDKAVSIAASIVENVSRQPLKGKDEHMTHALTTSLGLAMYPDNAVRPEELIDQADQALYSSKRLGKNRFCTAEQIIEEVAVLNRSMKDLYSPKFIDRIEEFLRLKELLGLAQRDKEKGVLISGTKGIGKTRLLEEFLKYVKSEGMPAIYVKAMEDDVDRPYGILIDGLIEHLRDFKKDKLEQLAKRLEKEELAEAANLIPLFNEASAKAGAAVSADDKNRRLNLFMGLVKLFEGAAANKTFTLAVDDFHWVDLASLNLIYYLFKDAKANPFLCATYLKVGDADAQWHKTLPLWDMLTRPQDKEMLLEVNLDPLTEEEVKELLVSVLPGLEASPALLDEIYKKTNGNPLFIEEAIRLFIDKGLIYFKDRKWRAAEIDKKDIPASFEETEKTRFEKLDQESKDILTDAALVGEGFNLEVLKKVSQKNEGQILDIIDMANKLGLLKSKSELNVDEFNFANRRIKEALYSLIDMMKAKQLHKEVATVLEDTHKGELNNLSNATNILAHYRLSDEQSKVAEYSSRISEIEKRIFSPEEAAGYIERIPEAEVVASVEEILEKSLAPESKKVLPDAIIALRSAIESAFLYPPNNQARLNFQEEAFAQLTKILEANKSITLSIVENALLVNGEELEKKELRSTLGDAFVAFLSNYRLNSMTFKKGLGRAEFAFFLDNLTKPEDYIKKAGGLTKLLKDNNIHSIKVDQVRYEKAHKLAAKFKQTKEVLKNMILEYPALQGLMGEGGQAILELKSKGDLKEAMDSLSGLIKNISESKSDVNEKADMILESMQKVADPISKMDPQQWQALKTGLFSTFSSLDPALKALLIKKDFYNIGAPGAIINDFVSLSSDQDIIAAVNDNLKMHKLSLEDLADMLKVVLLDSRRKEKLIPILERELIKSGLSTQDIAALLSKELGPADFSMSLFIEDFFKAAADTHLDKNVPRDMKSVIDALIVKDKDDVIESINEKILAELERATPDIRRAIIKDLGSILEILLSKDKSDMVMKVAQCLLDILPKETDLQNYGLIVDKLVNVIREFIYKKNYAPARQVIKTLKSQGPGRNHYQNEVINDAFNNLIDRRVGDSLAAAFNKDVEYGGENIVGVLIELGNYAINPLITALVTEDATKDPFDLYVRRRRIAAVLKQIGSDAVSRLKEKLSGENPQILRSIIEVLGYMEDKSVIPALAALADNPNYLVREELVKTFRKLWGIETLRLLAGFLKDSSAAVRKRTAAVLAEMTDKTLLPELEKFLFVSDISSEVKKIVEHVKKKYAK